MTDIEVWAMRAIMAVQDLYVRTVYRRLWRDAGL